LAALSILRCVTSADYTDAELNSISLELSALLVMKATTDPAPDAFSQATKTIMKKIRVSERSRPNPLQMHFTFQRVLNDLQTKGDRRKSTTIIAEAIKRYNSGVPGKCRLTSDERDAVLMLSDQEPIFLDTLKRHWRNFPVQYSAVPVNFLAFPWLNTCYEPTVKRSENPLWHGIETNSPTKNTAWLKVAIGRFQHKIQEQTLMGQPVNIRISASEFRKGSSTANFYESVCVFLHFEPTMRANVSVLAVQELMSKFYRGALERELLEKAKSKDPKLDFSDFRFGQAEMDYNPQAPVPNSQNTMDVAKENKHASELELDVLILKSEQQAWSEHLRLLRAFHAQTHTEKVTHQTAVETSWEEAALTYQKHLFPSAMCKDVSELLCTDGTLLNSIVDAQNGILIGDVYKVIVVNLSFLGPEHSKLRGAIKNFIASKMSNDKIKTCALVIAPSVGDYKHTYDEEHIEKSARDFLDDLRDSSEIVVKPCTIAFDETTMYSETRHLTHQLYMCIGKKYDKHKLCSAFANSKLWVRTAFVVCTGHSLDVHFWCSPQVGQRLWSGGWVGKTGRWEICNAHASMFVDRAWWGSSVHIQ
jgi:hypothetical protein